MNVFRQSYDDDVSLSLAAVSSNFKLQNDNQLFENDGPAVEPT